MKKITISLVFVSCFMLAGCSRELNFAKPVPLVDNQNRKGDSEKFNRDSWKDFIPKSCAKFFDGCNSCERVDGNDAICTAKACNEYKEPKCLE